MVMGLYDVELVKLSSMPYWAKDPSNMYLEVKHLKHHYGGEIVEEVHLDAKLWYPSFMVENHLSCELVMIEIMANF